MADSTTDPTLVAPLQKPWRVDPRRIYLDPRERLTPGEGGYPVDQEAPQQVPPVQGLGLMTLSAPAVSAPVDTTYSIAGFQLTGTQLLIGAAILYFLFTKK